MPIHRRLSFLPYKACRGILPILAWIATLPLAAATPNGSIDNPALTGESTDTTPAPVKKKKNLAPAVTIATPSPDASVTVTSPPTKNPPPPVISSKTDATNAPASIPPPPSTLPGPVKDDRTATLAIADLKDYDAQPEAVQRLITQGLALTTLKLSYKYGSSDPKNGGMDCSGTIYYLLNQAGLTDVPRDASGIYKWVWQKSHFEAVVSSNPKSFEFDRLKPGDLLFWTGTYRIERDPPVTHVMLYLGLNRLTGRRVMLGASEGRTYDNKPRYGVSVFDFKLPNALQLPALASADAARFIGYGPVPGLDQFKGSTVAPPTGP